MSRKLVVTKRQAIRDCKKIWKLVANGQAKSKFDALKKLPEMYNKYGIEHSYCPLCTYTEQFENRANQSCTLHCPFCIQYGYYCTGIGTGSKLPDRLYDYSANPVSFAKKILALKE